MVEPNERVVAIAVRLLRDARHAANRAFMLVSDSRADSRALG